MGENQKGRDIPCVAMVTPHGAAFLEPTAALEEVSKQIQMLETSIRVSLLERWVKTGKVDNLKKIVVILDDQNWRTFPELMESLHPPVYSFDPKQAGLQGQSQSIQ